MKHLREGQPNDDNIDRRKKRKVIPFEVNVVLNTSFLSKKVVSSGYQLFDKFEIRVPFYEMDRGI